MTYELPKLGTEGWRIRYPKYGEGKVYLVKETIDCIVIDYSGTWLLPNVMSAKYDRIYLTKEEAITVMKNYMKKKAKDHNITFVAAKEDNCYRLINLKG